MGWIGRHRLEALAEDGCRVVAVADPSADACAAVTDVHPDATVAPDLDGLLDAEPDGVVIATPSALHAGQAIATLERGIPVFCQKPLGRTARETDRVVEAARAADRLVGVDMSYRHTAALRSIRDRVVAGDLGEVYAAELVFHNAYGPDKDWFYDRELSGGGCVMDLGIHLIDLALWLLGGRVEGVSASLFAGGRRLGGGAAAVEDHAEVRLELTGG
ncbi:MAG: Gfo/Idh/MocA family protein, partial [Gemmatimonadota bacterium]